MWFWLIYILILYCFFFVNYVIILIIFFVNCLHYNSYSCAAWYYTCCELRSKCVLNKQVPYTLFMKYGATKKFKFCIDFYEIEPVANPSLISWSLDFQLSKLFWLKHNFSGKKLPSFNYYALISCASDKVKDSTSHVL